MPDTPEHYVDSFRVSTTAYGVSITWGANPPHPDPTGGTPPRSLVVLRMSLEHAKVVAMLIRRTLKEHERGNEAPIALPRRLLNELSLSSEDW